MEKSTFEQELERKGNITYTCRGISMLPLLRQKRDLFTITKKQGRCRKYDVALYKRADGAYVLHRIVKVLPDGYVFLGDNCLNKEYGIVMTSFVRDGKEHAADAGGCRLDAKLWYMLYPVRSLWKRLKMRIRNIIHK